MYIVLLSLICFSFYSSRLTVSRCRYFDVLNEKKTIAITSASRSLYIKLLHIYHKRRFNPLSANQARVRTPESVYIVSLRSIRYPHCSVLVGPRNVVNCNLISRSVSIKCRTKCSKKYTLRWTQNNKSTFIECPHFYNA